MALTKVRGNMVNMADLDLSNVGAIQADSIAGDADTNTSITFSGSDVITIANAGTNQLTFNDGSIVPVTDNDIDLGTSVLEFKDAFFDGTVTSDAFAGPLTGNVTGNADTATALASGRTIAMTGDVVWTSPSFDGSGNVTAAATIQTDAVDIAMLSATGTASSSTFLRGDNSWTAVSTPITALNNATANELVTVGSTTTELDAEANLTFDGGTLKVVQGSDSQGIYLDMNGNERGIYVEYDGTTNDALQILGSTLTTGRLAYLYSNSSSTGTRNLVRIRNDNTLATGTTSLLVEQDSTGPAAVILGDVGIGVNDPDCELEVSGTGAISVPSGTTAQRPTARQGMIRYNTTIDEFEMRDDSDWQIIKKGGSATGGTITYSGSDTIHTFTTSDDFVCQGELVCDILVVGGGAGAPHDKYHSAGGGAGGVHYATGYTLTAGTYTCTIGAGGAGGTSVGTTGSHNQSEPYLSDANANGSPKDGGRPGGESSFGPDGGTVLALARGGGTGGTHGAHGGDGGSGGGGCAYYHPYKGEYIDVSYTGFTRYGNDGGYGGNSTSGYMAGGGGGAGAAGEAGNTSNIGGDGGDGIQLSISGSATYYAGGGAGGLHSTSTGWSAAEGGLGGGGDGSTGEAEAGTANTGGGAGAGERTGTFPRDGKSGGSGIIIVRY